MSEYVVAASITGLRKESVVATAGSDRWDQRQRLVDEQLDETLQRFLARIAHDPIPVREADKAVKTSDVARITADLAEIKARIIEMRGDTVLVEERIPRYPGMLGPRGFAAIRASAAYPTPIPRASAEPMTVHVRGDGHPLRDARVAAYWETAAHGMGSAESTTDAAGAATLLVPAGLPLEVVVEPASEYWPMQVSAPAGHRSLAIDCPAIAGSRGETWWRDFVRSTPPVGSGRGIAVGIVDTGVGPHPALSHVRSVAAVGQGIEPGYPGADDLRGHGTHVAGVIGARADGGSAGIGLAPEADLAAIRVFGATGSTDQGDVAVAVRNFAREGMHLVNLSLGAPKPSQVERQRIRLAYERGVLCVAAAGNQSGPVDYPARYGDVVAVAAMGLVDAYEPGSPSAGRRPATAADQGLGGVFGANFSNRGGGIACHAPGVAIVSTVANAVTRTAGLAVMDGTSMAAPICTGLLAAILSADETYISMPPSEARSRYARRSIRTMLRRTGLRTDTWGRGATAV